MIESPANTEMVDAFRDAFREIGGQRDDDPNWRPASQIIGEALERRGLIVALRDDADRFTNGYGAGYARAMADFESLRGGPGHAAMSERDRAFAIAERVLDRVSGDPDDDLAILSRQLLRLRGTATPSAVSGADLRTLRRSLPGIVGPGTAELWLAFGRIERALGHGAAPPENKP